MSRTVGLLPHPEFTTLARALTRFRELIWNTLGPGGVGNGRAEGINTQESTPRSPP